MKYSKDEFRAACGGINRQYLNTYIKREKVEVGKDGMIDDQNELNNAFLVKMQAKNGGPVPVADVVSTGQRGRKKKSETKKEAPKQKEIKKSELEAEPEPVKVVRKIQAPVAKEVGRQTSMLSELEKERKEVELEKAKEDLELTRLKKQKMQGEVIPVDLVKGVFHRHSKSITDAYYQGGDQLLDELMHRFGISKKDIGPFKKRWTEILNQAVQESIDVSVHEVDGIVKEYSITRGKGERK